MVSNRIDLKDSQSMVSLGYLEKSEGNEKKAYELFLKGADKKNADAMLMIMVYYLERKDEKQAKKIAKKLVNL